MKINIDVDLDIGQQMKDICQYLKLKQKDVAKGINVKASLMSYYMNNQRLQRIDILRKFLEFCRNHIKNEIITKKVGWIILDKSGCFYGMNDNTDFFESFEQAEEKVCELQMEREPDSPLYVVQATMMYTFVKGQF